MLAGDMFKREQKAAREQIQEEWYSNPVYTRDLCEEYLKRYPLDGFIWAMYGETLSRLALFDEAETALQTANGLVDDDPTKATVYGFRGHLSRKLGDYPAAERWYRDAAALEPHYGGWQLYIGITLRHQRREAEAEECYRKALALEGDRDEYLLNLGYVLQARGDLEEAARCYSDALAIDPEYKHVKDSLEDVRKAIAFRKAAANTE